MLVLRPAKKSSSNRQRLGEKFNTTHTSSGALSVLALLAVALWRGAAVAGRLAVGTCSVLRWLLVTARLSSTAAVASTTRRWVIALRW